MFPFAALFIDKSFAIPLTKSSFTGLNKNLFEVVNFYLMFLIRGWSADFVIFS